MCIHACGASDWIVIFGRSFFMHIYNPQEYPNLLPAISLTSEEIRNLVSTYKLTFFVSVSVFTYCHKKTDQERRLSQFC